MGEIADMMLDGTLCEACGGYMGEGSGFPGYCSAQCAKERGAGLISTDDECREYLNELEADEYHEAVMLLRLFMGVGRKRAKKLVAQWRAERAITP